MERDPAPSSRVGRFGPRSLTFRVLLVVLVPMIGLQLLAWRDLRTERAAATAATEVKGLADLLHTAANVIVPLSKELTVTNSLVVMRNKGYDLPTLEAATGIDYTEVRDDAMAQVDDTLEQLAADGAGVTLTDGTDVAEVAVDLQTRVADLRTQFLDDPDSLSGAVVGGLAADLMQELGMAVAQLPGGEIVPAMQRGVIDAFEFNNPTSDMRFGAQDVAKYYSMGSFHQAQEFFEIIFNPTRHSPFLYTPSGHTSMKTV